MITARYPHRLRLSQILSMPVSIYQEHPIQTIHRWTFVFKRRYQIMGLRTLWPSMTTWPILMATGHWITWVFPFQQLIYRPFWPVTILLMDMARQHQEQIISVFHLPTSSTQQDFLMIPMELFNSRIKVRLSALLVIIPSLFGWREVQEKHSVIVLQTSGSMLLWWAMAMHLWIHNPFLLQLQQI